MTGSFREEWEVLIGDQAAYKVKGSSIFTSSRRLNGLHVFLAGNHEEDIPDFRVERTTDRRFERSCVVFAGESNTIVAQVNSLSFFFFFTLIIQVDPAYIRLIN